MPEAGILVMAYGTARDLDDVEAYYTHIRRGRPPAPEQVEDLRSRYRAIGGRSPLLEITRAQADGIGARLGIPAFVGQKHASPFIPDGIAALAEAGVERSVGLVLAPHYSSMSIGEYARQAANAAAEQGWEGKLEMIESWHLEAGYVSWLADAVSEAIAALPAEVREEAVVLFTAHSLPAKIVEAGDPYPRQLRETADAVAGAAGLEHYDVGWQSAGKTGVPWLGPDVTEMISALAAGGRRAVVVCPCGFVADHLEVLYDLDVEASALARDLGLAFARTRAPNDDARFLDVLAGVARRALERT